MKYLKNGKECLLCLSRQKLIRVTPEEKIRQHFISKLIETYKVPKNMILAEVPIGGGSKGRADIIVYEYDKETGNNHPLILIECKESNVELTDKVYDQVFAYDAILEVKLIIITNGKETIPFMWDNENEEYYEIESIPTYFELVNNTEFDRKIFDNNWSRPEHLNFDKDVLANLIDSGIIGEDSKSEHYSFFMNLYGLLLDDREKLGNLDFENHTFVTDGGNRFTTFGNAAGGGFVGDYRYFILEDANKDSQIVSISLMGKLSAKKHPKWGNSIGNTLLLVAIDDYELSHLSLELALDRFVIKDKEIYTILHDGTLTIGKKGRAKNIDVINYIKAQKPNLIKENKVYLGSLDNSLPFNWQRQDVKEFTRNIIEYAIVRDDFRKSR